MQGHALSPPRIGVTNKRLSAHTLQKSTNDLLVTLQPGVRDYLQVPPQQYVVVHNAPLSPGRIPMVRNLSSNNKNTNNNNNNSISSASFLNNSLLLGSRISAIGVNNSVLPPGGRGARSPYRRAVRERTPTRLGTAQSPSPAATLPYTQGKKTTLSSDEVVEVQRQRIEQLQKRIDVMGIEYVQLADKHNELSQENRLLRTQQEELQRQLAYKSNSLHALEVDHLKDGEMLRFKEIEGRKLQESVSELQREIEIWKENYDKAEKQYNSTREQNDNRLNELEFVLKEVRGRLQGEQEKTAYADSYARQLESERDQLRLALEDLQAQLRAEQRKSASKARQAANQLEQDQQIIQLQDALQNIHDTLEAERAAARQYQQAVQSLNDELNYLRSRAQEFESAGNIFRDLETRTQFLQAENQRLNQLIVGRCRDMLGGGY